MNHFFTILLCLGVITISFSQTQTLSTTQKKVPIHQCDVHDHQQRKFSQNEELRIYNDQIEQFYRETMNRLSQNIDPAGVRSGTVYTIPVVVHVMHLPGTDIGQDENISMAQIEQGIADLNDGFRNSGAYNQAIDNSDADDDGVISADVEIEFCLASTDPSGNPTNGVNRISTSYSNLFRDDVSTTTTCLNGGSGEQEGDMKELSFWDSNDYLNIWLVNEICKLSSGGSGSSNCGVAGYAYYASAHGACFDGIVNEARFFGTSTSNSTVHIHEAGHYFNVRHTFNDPDGSGIKTACNNDDCLTEGDFVCDTPPDNSTSSVSCSSSATANTCGTDADDLSANNPFTTDRQDLYENYMDYGFGSCQHVFTQGQKDRMRTALTGIRASLLTSTGCDIAASNVAYFYDGGSAEAEVNATTASGCRDYYDIDIEVRLYKAATASTTVNFVLDASSTAADGADIELNTSSVTFSIGESSKNVSVRIYNDLAIESTEVGIINISSVTGGATAATFNQTHRVSISDDDNAPSGNRPVIFSDDFESGSLSNWTVSRFGGCSTDNTWAVGANGDCMDGSYSAYVSNDSGVSNDYTDVASCPLLYANIDATGYTGLEITFDYTAGGDGTNDWGRIIGRTTTGTGSFGYYDSKYSGQSCPKGSNTFNIPASFDGQNFDMGFVWNTEGMGATQSALTVDNIEVTADATDVESTLSSSSSEYLGPNADVYFMSADGELIARIKNLSNHDYGCTTVSVSTDGTGSFNGGSGTVFQPYDFVDKTVNVTPTTNNASGSYEITVYYTEAELSGWEAATGDLRGSLNMVKSSVSLSSADVADSNLDVPATSTFATGSSYGYTTTFYTGFSNFGLTNTPPSALPVELTDFYGRKENAQTHLFWSTESEINNDYFIIERSGNGISYTELGQVEGVGNSTTKVDYDFIDSKPNLGLNYYRLIQVDMDGTRKTYGPIQVNYNKAGMASIFPIPSKSGKLNLVYDAGFSGELNWEVINSQGQMVQMGEFELSSGINRFVLKDMNLSNGVYYIRLTQDNLIQTKRFVIVN